MCRASIGCFKKTKERLSDYKHSNQLDSMDEAINKLLDNSNHKKIEFVDDKKKPIKKKESQKFEEVDFG